MKTFNPDLLKIISQPYKAKYYCPVCSSELELNTVYKYEDWVCDKPFEQKPSDHILVIYQTDGGENDYLYFEYRFRLNDKLINIDVNFALKLLTFNYLNISIKDLTFSSFEELMEQINLILLFS